MKRIESLKRLIILQLSLIGLLFHTVVYAYYWFKEYYPYLKYHGHANFYFKGHVLIILIYFVLLLFFASTYGVLKIGYLKPIDVFISEFFSLLFANVLSYFQISLMANWVVKIRPIAEVMLIQAVFSGVWVIVCNTCYFRVFPPRKLLLICDLELKDNLIRKISGRKDLYEISKCVSAGEPLYKLKAEVQNCDAMMLYGIEEQKRNMLLKYCYERSIRIYVAPEITDILLRGADKVHSFDTPFLLLRNYGLSFEQRIIKRLMDVVISGVLLLTASPFMLLTALAVRLEDGGPALFKQERVTVGGRKFDIYKFRSMVVDAEKDGAQFSSRHDSRITKVGKFIRATRLDELPQLLNILKGDMSIVGPRPERQQYIDEFCQETPEFIYRLKVKAGLTGYAQIYGKYNTTPLDKLKLDLMYIETYSVLMDIRLMFLTLKIMFTKESTEGVEDGQNHA